MGVREGCLEETTPELDKGLGVSQVRQRLAGCSPNQLFFSGWTTFQRLAVPGGHVTRFRSVEREEMPWAPFASLAQGNLHSLILLNFPDSPTIWRGR